MRTIALVSLLLWVSPAAFSQTVSYGPGTGLGKTRNKGTLRPKSTPSVRPASEPATPGTFLPTYVGPHAGDLTVVSSQVSFTGTDFLFSATLQAPVNTTPGAFYVWGVDRGAGTATANFAELGLPKVTFDSVVVVVPGGDSVVNDLEAGIATPLPPENITINGTNVLVRVPLSMLNSKGLNPEQYAWNLWPRWGGVPFGDSQIANFSPHDRNSVVKSERVTDPSDDFPQTYVGPHAGDLDVVSAQVSFTGSDFLFAATLNAPVRTTAGAYYVFGVDRGAGAATANFAKLGLPRILFDAVVVANPGGDSRVNDLDAGINTPLPAENITVNGNSILVRVPLSMLNSKGLTPEQYTWNLWPRWGGVPFGDPQISDFAPNDHNASVISQDAGDDPTGDFLQTYVGPHGGDLDVVSGQVSFTGSDFLFSATMQAPIKTTAGAFYVWGVNRGAGAETADFAQLGLPNIIFDVVVVANPGGDSVVNDLDAGIASPLPPENVTINGNNILVRVPLSMLTSRGLNPEQYTWNLWPRWGGVPFGDAQISDFYPDERNAIVKSDAVVDPAGDFLRDTFAGPNGGDLDVVSGQVTFTGTDFVFAATMQAPIKTTAGAFYVWGVDRGAGPATANFLELGYPKIMFDTVVVAVPGGDSVVNDLDAGIATPLPPENITINGNSILVRVPLSLLESKGLSPEQYMWNLWPRWGGVPFGDAQISDFAPSDHNSKVNVSR